MQIVLKDGADFIPAARASRCRGIITGIADVSPGWRVFKPQVTEIHPGQFADLDCTSIGLPDLTTAVLVTRTEQGLTVPLMSDLDSDVHTEPYTGDVLPEDVLYVYTTSGTTGYSKLIHRTHKEILDLYTILWGQKDWEMVLKTKGSAGLNERLLGWSGGYPYYTYVAGDVRVLLDLFSRENARKDGAELWNALRAEQCGVAALAPRDLVALAAYVKASPGELESYRVPLVASGGQPVTKAVMEDALYIADKLLLSYALTEAGSVSKSIVTEPQKDFFAGKVVPGMDLKILDPDSGEPCTVGKIGDIYIRAQKSVFTGYFNKLEEVDPQTKEAFAEDGYLKTNDVGFQDDDDNLYVLGRSRDVIMMAGYPVHPAWLESLILKHPKVDKACVVPVSDPVTYHKICACVTGTNLSPEELKSFCEDMFAMGTSHVMTPMPDFFMVVQELPFNLVGKTDRAKLKEMAEGKFGVSK